MFFRSKLTRWAVGLTTAILIALLYSFLPLTAPGVASPDEAANRYFAGLFASKGELWRFEPVNLLVKDQVHPRSMRVVDGFIVPGGFLGLPVLFGSISALFGPLGPSVLPFIGAILAVCGVAAWGGLVSNFFGRRIGLIAAFILAFHPIWWYESARTLMPNVPFIALVIIALWLLIATPIKESLGERPGLILLKSADAALAGIAFGFALAIRPSEAHWLLLGGAIIAWAARSSFPWRRSLVAALFTALATAPFVILGVSAYGSPFATGYGSAGDTVVAELPQGRGAELLSSVLGPLQPYLFPFGFAPRDAFRHFLDFGLGITSWWTWLVAGALFALAVEWWRGRRARGGVPAHATTFAAVAACVSIWLIFFYGSWTIRDNPDPDAVTIGSSYLRYWLPIFLFSTVPVAWLVARASELLGGLRGRALAAAFLACFALSGAMDVFYAPQEGLLATRSGMRKSDIKRSAILDATPSDAIIVVDRADKYLFPDRQVIVPLRSDHTYAALGRLKDDRKLYYFGISFPDKDLEWLRTVKLPPLGLGIEPVFSMDEETLYRFVPLNPPAAQSAVSSNDVSASNESSAP